MSIVNNAQSNKESKTRKTGKLKNPLVVAAFIAVVGVLLWKVLPRNAAHTTVQWRFGDQTLNLDVQKDMSDPEALIEKLMSRQYSKAGTLALLRKKGVYATTDPAIIPALQQLCPDEEPAGENLLKRQQRLQACLDKAVVKDLRDLASQHRAPFQYFGRVVKIGTPADSEPRSGQAFVCDNGGLLGHQLEIDAPEGGGRITVDAIGYYVCTGYSRSVVPDIQIGAQDARRLFGRATMKFEKAVAVIIR